MSKKIDRIGEVKVNNFRSKMEFANGCIKSPYDKSVLEVGYLGEGSHTPSKFRKATKVYTYWKNMLDRCYNSKTLIKHPTYLGCTVSEEWHNFQVFGDWYDENYYEVDDETMHLEKDFLVKGNKIYSRDTCVFAPQKINALLVTRKLNRGSSPIGVYWDKSRDKYASKCKVDGRDIKLGRFDNEVDAFLAYKNKKEKVIKQVADKYKDNIPKKLYDAMYNYKVEITD